MQPVWPLQQSDLQGARACYCGGQLTTDHLPTRARREIVPIEAGEGIL
jgi:hypothetical protein